MTEIWYRDTVLYAYYDLNVYYYYFFSFYSFFLFAYLGFLSGTFTIDRATGEWGGNLFNSSLPLPPASQALRLQPGDYWRELTSAHSWQPDSNRKLLLSQRKLLTTKLRDLLIFIILFCPNLVPKSEVLHIDQNFVRRYSVLCLLRL